MNDHMTNERIVLGTATTPAFEVRATGIRVDCVGPGFMLSGRQEPMLRGECGKSRCEDFLIKQTFIGPWNLLRRVEDVDQVLKR